MTEEEERFLHQLQGRIMACEKVNQALLLALAAHQANWSAIYERETTPLAELDAIEKALVGGMQHATFHAADENGEIPTTIADIAWEAAGQSVRQMFHNVRAKLTAFADRAGEPNPPTKN
jgi:hypothetical protein